MSVISKILTLFIGDKSKKDIRDAMSLVSKINDIGLVLKDISNDELRDKTKEFKLRLCDYVKEDSALVEGLYNRVKADDISVEEKENLYSKIDLIEERIYREQEKCLNDILPEAFAVVKETAYRFFHNEELVVTANEFDIRVSAVHKHVEIRDNKAVWLNSWDVMAKKIVWDMIHYDVQLIGGTVLHSGKIAEMATGEGKTLVSTLALYLNALTGRGVHLVTVNDYLAKRDAAWMGPIFEFHGLRTDCIDLYESNSEARKEAYLADITYGTNNEFGFDYLRDNMAHSPNDIVQRKHNYAIIDEVDSVLIDDARTPLIISGPVPKGDKQEFNELKPKVDRLVSAQREYLNTVLLEAKKLIADNKTTEGGFNLLKVYRGLPKNKALIKFLSQEGVKALLQKTENFYMREQNKEMIKVDESLYFVIDERNNSIQLTDKGVEFLSDSDDSDFFIMPDIGEEIAKLEREEIDPEKLSVLKEQIYRDFSIKSERIHTVNQLLKAHTLFEKDKDYVLIDGQVKIVDEQTGRIMEGRRYSDGLHQALEAKENVKVELATQTFATITLQNYFRMYKKLSGMTGTAETEAGEFWKIYKLDVVVVPTNKPIKREDNDDLIYKTTREKFNAVIDQVVKLSSEGRPVLVGTTSVEISELLSRALKIRKIKHNVLNAKLHKKEADIIEEAGVSGVVTIATNMAGRGTDIKLTEETRKAGGLAIIGTEKHDSRRVDRQLMGRSGRQGDVGSSQFFISLDDSLMRLFGSDKIAKLMDRMGHKEGDVIQHPMISRSIERAQKKVEENNFGVRKRLLEYDDVMNSQRDVIYTRRHNALFGTKLSIDIANMIYDICQNIVSSNKETGDLSNLEFEHIKAFSFPVDISEDRFNRDKTDKIIDEVYNKAYNHYIEKCSNLAEITYAIIDNMYKSDGARFENISVPFTDGVKVMHIVTNLKEAYETKGKQLIKDFEKNITLHFIDDCWKDHLREMDELKQSVQSAVYEQKDPLLIYKFESFNLFKGVLNKINYEIVSFLFKGFFPQDENRVKQASNIKKKEKLSVGRDKVVYKGVGASNSETENSSQPIVNDSKIGRNEKVSIKNISTGEEKTLKFKQAEVLIEQGDWVLLSKL
ncbi:preprotein translocase subunit SecA [Ichthyobacterium seriolicida]|uniref:Protein translocase subunit SecA n=1 Tax=Ichthyobacterium seriolicida TaxID=242600 RepID=A0A1J1E9G8_9FLAO|nr:preprotein translocase subunit SecA [Ichthyobacterium seriolicida]BAV94547.1 protein export cytoplasm protein SecA ATPase RNA helicase [Ichthyobacterium seriolicida]